MFYDVEKESVASCRIKIGNAINSCNVFYVDSKINQIYTPCMRPSERRKYRDQLQEHEEQQREQRSFQYQNRNPRRGDRNRMETNQPSRINDKYGRKKKSDFLGILTPSEETTSKREDYNARRSQRESDGRSQRSDRTQPSRNGYRRKEGEYVKCKEELDEELEAYRRQRENSENRQSRNIIEGMSKEEKVQRREEEEQDLSFTMLKSERNRGKGNKNNEYVGIKQRRQRQRQENNDTEEWIVTASRREEKPIERRPLQQKIQEPSRPKRQIRQQNSSNRSLNQGFNEASKESINQSSNWLDQRILDDLDEDEPSQQDILSNANSSYVSSIQGNSRLHHDFNSYHLSSSQPNSILNDQPSFQSILQTIQNSKDLETRQLQLQITSVKNILEIVVKEVSVSKLGMNIELSVKQEGVVVKNSEIDQETLKEYISFEQIRVSHPRVINDSPIVSTFTLCKLKIPSSNQDQSKSSSKFIKKEKKLPSPNQQNNCRQLLRVIKLQLKCMNCQKCSEVPVLQSTNQASLSCRKCDEQMIAKLTKLSLQ